MSHRFKINSRYAVRLASGGMEKQCFHSGMAGPVRTARRSRIPRRRQQAPDVSLARRCGQRGRLGATRIGVSTQRDLSLALIGTGFGYEPATRAWQARVLAPLLPRVRDIRRFGSAALDLCHVADGSLDAYYERGLNPWDMAAGSLIVTEAGGTVSGLDGAPASRDFVIAGGACANDLNLLLQAIHEKVGPHPAP